MSYNSQFIQINFLGVIMDVGWGGVPRMVPSNTALKYINDNVKVQVTKHTAFLMILSKRIMSG